MLLYDSVEPARLGPLGGWLFLIHTKTQYDEQQTPSATVTSKCHEQAEVWHIVGTY